MEYIHGCKVDNVEGLKALGVKSSDVSENLLVFCFVLFVCLFVCLYIFFTSHPCYNAMTLLCNEQRGGRHIPHKDNFIV